MARMQAICDKVTAALEGRAPYLQIRTDDNLCSSVVIHGSFDARETWTNGIFHNSRWFIIFINPPKGARYYDPERHEKVTVELTGNSHQLPVKFRKTTAKPETVIEKIKAWVDATREQLLDLDLMA